MIFGWVQTKAFRKQINQTTEKRFHFGVIYTMNVNLQGCVARRKTKLKCSTVDFKNTEMINTEKVLLRELVL